MRVVFSFTRESRGELVEPFAKAIANLRQSPGDLSVTVTRGVLTHVLNNLIAEF